MSLRKTALRNLTLKQTLVDTFAELISEKWIEPVKGQKLKTPSCWYLLFFKTKSAKPLVVYDKSVVDDGQSLNQAVFSGENLLKNLLEVLTRFRLGKFVCVADLSRCFFQVKIPLELQDLFRIVWFKNNNLNNHVEIHRFTRHVWGINFSPFVAFLPIHRLVEKNPINACELTLKAIEPNRYMDDGINFSPFVAFLPIHRLVEENPINACELTLKAIEPNRYMDDMLFASKSLEGL